VKPRGATTEEFFRDQRHAAIAEVARSEGVHHVVLGHTADDLAENFLMHLMRGAGLRGLTFQFSQRKGSLVLLRPLWQTSRTKVLKYLTRFGVNYREDETNRSMDFTRNRVRNLLIPFVEREFNPSVRLALRRTTHILGGAQEYVHERAARHLRRMQRSSGDRAALPMCRLTALPEVLALEVIHQWLVEALGAVGRPSFEQSQNVLKLARSSKGRRLRLTAGAIVSKSGDNLVAIAAGRGSFKASGLDLGSDAPAREELARRFAVQNSNLPLVRFIKDVPLRTDDRDDQFSVQLTTLDGRTLSLQGSVFTQEVLPLEEVENDPATELALPLVLRNRRAGDRLSPSVRLKSVLINDKVPYYIRDFLIVVADANGRFLAIVGMERVNARLRATVAQGVAIKYDFIVGPHDGGTDAPPESTS
jgi:tRNA(Ile)-lysidine synthase